MSTIIETAQAFREKIMEMAQDVPNASKGKYLDMFPNFVEGTAYALNRCVIYNGELYENLLAGNSKSPEEASYAWRHIDTSATDLDYLS